MDAASLMIKLQNSWFCIELEYAGLLIDWTELTYSWPFNEHIFFFPVMNLNVCRPTDCAYLWERDCYVSHMPVFNIIAGWI